MSDPDSPWDNSVVRRKVRTRLERGAAIHVTMLDIDSTLTGDPAAANRVRATLETRGDVVVFNTSRTEEMVMSSEAYSASRATGWFHRPPPHLGRHDGQRVYVPPETVEPRGVLDGDVIAGSTGTRIVVRQHDGRYLPDTLYGSGGEPPSQWRQRAMTLVAGVAGIEPAAIEDPANYERGLVDVYPPDYRIQVAFTHPRERQALGARLAGDPRHDLRLLDDSEPREERYKAFVLPRWASKARAARRILHVLRSWTGDSPLDVLFVGDSLPDLHMGLLGSLGVPSTLLLVGRSRLTDVLRDPDISHFACIPLLAVKRRLRPVHGRGYYAYHAPCGAGEVAIVLGEEAFPGTAAVETVERYLDSMPPDAPPRPRSPAPP